MAGKAMTKTTTTTEKVVEKKTYKAEDLIPCRSTTNGELLIVGEKSNRLYKFADYNSIEDIEYQDLLYAVRLRKDIITKPRLIILDEDFITQNKEVSDIYDSLYSVGDLYDLLNRSLDEIKFVVPTLPIGAKDALKGIVATSITNGSFDSVNKIKFFDEFFGTDMLTALVEN